MEDRQDERRKITGIPSKLENRLTEFFKPHNERLSMMLNRVVILAKYGVRK